MFQCLECGFAVSETAIDLEDDMPELTCSHCGSDDIDLYIEPDRVLTVRDVYPAE